MAKIKDNFENNVLDRVFDSKLEVREFVLMSILRDNPDLIQYISLDPYAAIKTDVFFDTSNYDEMMKYWNDLIIYFKSASHEKLNELSSTYSHDLYSHNVRRHNMIEYTTPRLSALKKQLDHWDAPKSLTSVKENALINFKNIKNFRNQVFANVPTPVKNVMAPEDFRKHQISKAEEGILRIKAEEEKHRREWERKVAFLKALAKEFPPVVAKP